MSNTPKYILSFTALSLRLNEMVKVAKTFVENDISDLKKVRESGVVFNSVKTKTSNTEFLEIRKRLEKLTPDQMNILIYGDLISQKQVAFLAVCKYYDFIRDFTIEVIRDKSLVYDYHINESDYNSFINNRIHTHPELEDFSDSTLKKAKQVLFRILEQAGIIDNAVDKTIQPQLIQSDVIKAITKDDPAWLKIFMMPDKDIKQLKY
jgi:hypothetical protein